jgi:glycerol-3-phosphate dehydrogenase
MNRDDMIRSLDEPGFIWDTIVVGGGASGLGIALEAVTRGYRTLLLERGDFAQGTSSRSTKLIHGGVRYLAQGNFKLVMEALRERGILKKNAPHLVKDLPFVIPCYSLWEVVMYTVGLTLYDLLAGRRAIGRSVPLSRKRTIRLLPAVKTRKLFGGLLYHDCQFDDARLAIDLCRTFCDHGGVALNYMNVQKLIKEDGKLCGVNAKNMERGINYTLRSKQVINATGVFINEILRMDFPDCRDAVVPSQGIHLVTDKKFLNGEDALMIPKTPDGRILFAIPWHNRMLIGTTDVKKEQVDIEPLATKEEIEYILETARRYFENPPGKKDILSVFAGLRPLAAPASEGKKTKEISRGHKILISDSGLISLTGGKWTTYRKMGEDVIDRMEKVAGNPPSSSVTSNLTIINTNQDLIRGIIEESPEKEKYISEKLKISAAQIILAVRYEMARTLEDVLARRTRALQLDALESIRIASATAEIMSSEMGLDSDWQNSQIEAFTKLAKGYLLNLDPDE